jgi:hypothetical protein
MDTKYNSITCCCIIISLISLILIGVIMMDMMREMKEMRGDDKQAKNKNDF